MSKAAKSTRDTPMMQQYRSIKGQYPDALLFYRMGDFYELFFEDAERAAPLLDITLTSRDRDKPDPIPMCGVPVHSADGYVKKLADLGLRVAICEQVEDPKATGGRRLVKREVVEVVTPGLVGDPAGLDATREVALVSVVRWGDAFGLAVLDASTGSFRVTQVPAANEGPPGVLLDEIARVAPREVLVPDDDAAAWHTQLQLRAPDAALTTIPAASCRPSEAPANPQGFEPSGGADMAAAASILCYLELHQPSVLAQSLPLRRYALGDAMVLDSATRKHLELFESSEDGGRRGTLIERIDLTQTPLGARRLVRWVAYPLLSPDAIRRRQDAVAALADRDRARGRLRDALARVRDLERILARCARPGAEPRDLAALRASLEALPAVRESLEGSNGDGLELGEALPEALPIPAPVPELAQLLAQAIVDEPRAIPRGSRGASETGYVREGFRSELDLLREAARKGREWIAGLEAQERERSGIATLKVKFHPVHGYSLEVSKTQLDRVPGDYERKQTLANAERFTTPELREIESQVLGANDKAAALERELFESVRQEALAASAAIRSAAEAVAELDALQSLAEVARRDGWVRPEVDDGLMIEIDAGRHPVVERMLEARGGDAFVPNDTRLDPGDVRILLLTGPNMSGKSTYLRQVALLVLLAQVGSWVPASRARIGAVDRVFTRVGASDRLAHGESTFMVEMRETAEILAGATPHSLVILDEIGRGTSTFDGLSIAWAVAEHLHDAPGLGARTLFATHYHELADLSDARDGVRNAHFEAREWEDEVVFLRRLVSGPANRSYGIEVARLAGLPTTVIARAREVLAALEEGEVDADGAPRLAGATSGAAPVQTSQLPLFAASGPSASEARVLNALRALDPDDTTPRRALERLAEWSGWLRDEGEPS